MIFFLLLLGGFGYVDRAAAQTFCVHEVENKADLAFGNKFAYKHLSKAEGKHPFTYSLQDVYTDIQNFCCTAKDAGEEHLVRQLAIL